MSRQQFEYIIFRSTSVNDSCLPRGYHMNCNYYMHSLWKSNAELSCAEIIITCTIEFFTLNFIYTLHNTRKHLIFKDSYYKQQLLDSTAPAEHMSLPMIHAVTYNCVPSSHRGQHLPGTGRGLRHAGQCCARQYVSPSAVHSHVTQSSSSHAVPTSCKLPSLEIQPGTQNATKYINRSHSFKQYFQFQWTREVVSEGIL